MPKRVTFAHSRGGEHDAGAARSALQEPTSKIVVGVAKDDIRHAPSKAERTASKTGRSASAWTKSIRQSLHQPGWDGKDKGLPVRILTMGIHHDDRCAYCAATVPPFKEGCDVCGAKVPWMDRCSSCGAEINPLCGFKRCGSHPFARSIFFVNILERSCSSGMIDNENLRACTLPRTCTVITFFKAQVRVQKLALNFSEPLRLGPSFRRHWDQEQKLRNLVACLPFCGQQKKR
jgi:hypothetical protein